ncbi:unnamed protein product [Malus baccata var. baccata]
MRNTFQDTLAAHRNELVSLLSRYVARGNGILQPHQMINELENVIMEDEGMQKLKDSSLISKVLQSAQEAIVLAPFVAFALRPGVWEYVRVNVYELSVDHLSAAEYLRFKEELMDGDKESLEPLLDFLRTHKHDEHVSLRRTSINPCVLWIICPVIFYRISLLVSYLTLSHNTMMLNDRILSIPRLQSALAKAEEYLSKFPPTTPYSEFEFE